MKKIVITTSVENGKLKRNRIRIKEAIESFEGKEIQLSIQKKKKMRSQPENRYYFGVVVVIFQKAIRSEWGEIWSKEQVHDLLKSRFLFTEKVNEQTGEIVQLPKSTTECSTDEFEDFLFKCRQFAREWFNTEIPLPNENLILES